MMAAKASLYYFLEELLDFSPDEMTLDCAQRLLQFSAIGARFRFRRDVAPKIRGYVETVLPTFSMDDFRYHYRLSRMCFEQVLSIIGHQHPVGPEEVELRKQLLLFVWYMSTQESMREISHTFGVAKSTAHSIIYRVSTTMILHMFQIVLWPDEESQRELSEDNRAESGLPGIVGFIDGTHIRLAICPSGDQDYINRKGFPSMQLQVVVDSKMRIIHAYAGWPGCTHDARVLRNSGLYQNAEDGKLFGQEKFIIGDSAYPVRPWLITPFKDNGRLQQNQRRFNRKISSMRQVVERTIGHLKCRFRRLRCLHLYDVEAITKVILCGCLLHNMCVLSGDELNDFIEADPDVAANNPQHVLGNAAQGVALRDRLMTFID